jgi:hypothetical protein
MSGKHKHATHVSVPASGVAAAEPRGAKCRTAVPTSGPLAPGKGLVSVTLGELKDLLLRFSWERRDWPREDVQREFGALVLYVMQQADRIGVDLVSAGEACVARQSSMIPTLVSTQPELDA